jgi:hypothetical protein
MEKILEVKSKIGNSQLTLEKDVINESSTNYPKPVTIFKVRNERKNFKERLKTAYNLILNGEIEDSFYLNSDETNYLNNVLSKQEKEYQNLIKQYNTKDRYISDMLKFDIKSFLKKHFDFKVKFKNNIERNLESNLLRSKEDEIKRYVDLGVKSDKILFSEIPMVIWNVNKNEPFDAKNQNHYSLVQDDGKITLKQDETKVLSVSSYTELPIEEINNSNGIIVTHSNPEYWMFNGNNFRFTFI